MSFTGIVQTGNNTLLVSFGHQDKDGYVMEMDIDGLLVTMEVVHECTNR